MPLHQVVPAARNPKKHDLPALLESITAHGFADVLILDERTQRLVAGHGRTEALVHMLEHGDPLPEGLLVGDEGEWLVPVLRGWTSRDDSHAEAFVIGHNRLVEAGGWDDKVLVEMLHDLNAFEPQLFDGLGFVADELDELFRTVDPERLPGEVADGDGVSFTLDADDVPAPADTRRRRTVECPVCLHEFIPGEDD